MSEDVDVKEYNKMFYKCFRAKALGAMSSMRAYYKTFKKKHMYPPYVSTVKKDTS
jgi:hypothetical protein